jgi:D-amino-acid dehydrogenase
MLTSARGASSLCLAKIRAQTAKASKTIVGFLDALIQIFQFQPHRHELPKQVTILGAGVIGLSTALYCARRGMKVTIIDQKPRQRDGCSFGNAGMIVPSHFIPLAAPGMVKLGLKWMWNPESPFYIKPRLNLDLMSWGLEFWKAATKNRVDAAAPVLRDLSLLSRQCYEEIGLDFGLVKRDCSCCAKSSRLSMKKPTWPSMANQLGIPAEVLDAKATAALDPAVTMDVCGSVFFPKDCHLAPGRFIAAVEAELLSSVSRCCGRRRCVALRWKARRFARSARQKVKWRVKKWCCVAACGRRAGEGTRFEAADAGGQRLQPHAGESEAASRAVQHLHRSTARCDADGWALRVGGTMEMAGIDESITPRRVRGITRAFPDYFPAFSENDFAEVKPWSGLRPVSPDGMPYLGRTQRWKNLTIATGHAMMGLSLAPATGKIVTDVLAARNRPWRSI